MAGIKILPKLATSDRRLIRFNVHRVPQISGDQIMPHGNEWFFRADIKVSDTQYNAMWYQPSQEEEPEPDADIFFSVMKALLAMRKPEGAL